ncbi:Proton-dependent oligopeptide transporter family [Corchorus olitorius]|uniref:Proton-dependent oligopeptide transporter family n=1 Tax=Corchorus olitorius TaxID=93759 RepID=A0A1R3KI63_9ROSI|nr:Proton-dependent oligopeptide transporter family [Corchorus olitorius]
MEQGYGKITLVSLSDNNMAEALPLNADESSHGKSSENDKKGGIKTMPFILGNDMCERFAMLGFSKNMVNYLTKELHMPLTKAANTVTNFNGTASLMPLLGAFVSDSFAGRFWTITLASIIYLLRMISLTLSATLPHLRPPQCQGNQICIEADGRQYAILYLSLLLASLGSGGIRPCVAAFGADQFIEDDPRQPKKTWVYFNWYYFAIGVAVLCASTLLVYVQDNVGWGWGLGIPTITMAFSIILFLVGYSLYRHLDPSGSPYTRVLQVSVAAFRKRKASSVSDSNLYYSNEVLDASISKDGVLQHTPQLKFLDKAAIETEEDKLNSSDKPNLWRLNTVHRVEELKTVIRLLPIGAAGILFSTADAQQSTFSIQQANTMDKHLSNTFQIPSASLSIFGTSSMLITIVLYDRVLVPFARKFTGHDRGISYLLRMAIGLFISILSTLVAGFVEVKRKDVASANGLINSPKAMIPISVFWLVPQYSLHGIAEAFKAIGHLEFFYDQAPESMRSTATALYWLAVAAGNYTSTFLVTIVHKYTKWLPNQNLNTGKLEYFYWLITCLQVMNFVYYLVCAKFYTSKPIQFQNREELGEPNGEVELVKTV